MSCQWCNTRIRKVLIYPSSTATIEISRLEKSTYHFTSAMGDGKTGEVPLLKNINPYDIVHVFSRSLTITRSLVFTLNVETAA